MVIPTRTYHIPGLNIRALELYSEQLCAEAATKGVLTTQRTALALQHTTKQSAAAFLHACMYVCVCRYI